MKLYGEAQKACVKALAEIFDRAAVYESKTSRELPTLVWTIGYDGMGAEIDQHTSGVRTGDNDLFATCTQHEAFEWWVEVLKAERVVDRVESDGRRFLSARLRTDGIAVVLRTLLPATEDQS